MKRKILILLMFVFGFLSCKKDTPSLVFNSNTNNTIKERITEPIGFIRGASTNSWQKYLQNLELLPGNPKILDYKGKPISDQNSHVAIINFDVGNKDLQQCADAIIRIRAEYLYKNKKYDDIRFHFTSGDLYKWTDHANGIRPVVNGNKVRFVKKIILMQILRIT